MQKDQNGKYNFPDSLNMKTKAYQWYVKSKVATGGKILNVRNPETKYTVMQDYGLGAVDSLWAVMSSSPGEERLQDRAKERILQRAVPACSTFDSFVKMRQSCWILEEKDGEFFCDCFEGSKGRLCKHSIGMMYFAGYLTPEDDVRAVPLGGKRKRGRPAKNRHCLLRSPTGSQPSVGQPCDFQQVDAMQDIRILDAQVPDAQVLDAQVLDAQVLDSQGLDAQVVAAQQVITQPSRDVLDTTEQSQSDLCLRLESDDSYSDNDMSIIGSANYTYKPPKKKAKVSQMTSRRGRSVRGRGRVPHRVESEHVSPDPLPPQPEGRRPRGRPRGSRTVRGRSGMSPMRTNPPPSAETEKRPRGRPRGTGSRARGN